MDIFPSSGGGDDAFGSGGEAMRWLEGK